MRFARLIARAGILTGILVLSGVMPAQEVDFLDLGTVGPNPFKHKKFVPADNCGNMGGASMGFGLSCPPATYPFKLTLLNLDRDAVSVPGEAIALVRLENIGHDAAFIPWSANPDDIELPDDHGKFGYLNATLGFAIRQGREMEYFRVPVELYGSKKVPGSLREIDPGQSVELRIKLDCSADKQSCRKLKAGPGKISVDWTECEVEETYERCRVSTFSNRLRMVSSNQLDFNISSVADLK